MPTAIPIEAEQPGGHSAKNEVREFAGRKLAAGLCGILLGGLGIHKFILGLNKPGIIMLVVSLVCGFTSILIIPLVGLFAMGIIGIVEGIIYLTKTDEEFFQMYAVEKREWF